MIKIYREFTELKNLVSASVVAIGNFDGIHYGHQAVLRQAIGIKKQNGCKLIVLTFYPHPLKVIRPGNEPKNIISFRNKVHKMEEMEVDIILTQRFSISFSKLSAFSFVKNVLIDALKATDVIIGDDFHFGNKRKGNIAYLKSKEFKSFFNVHVVKEVSGKSGRYSSSLIRDMIINGKMLEAKTLLGYYYEVEGIVVHGQKLGKELGFPTANINYVNTIIPEDGIYAGWININDKYYMGAISTGCRPQFKGKKRFLEVHILNFSGDIYGTRIKVSLVKKIRNEEVFTNVEELKKKMTLDCKEVIKILKINNL